MPFCCTRSMAWLSSAVMTGSCAFLPISIHPATITMAMMAADAAIRRNHTCKAFLLSLSLEEAFPSNSMVALNFSLAFSTSMER